MPPREGAAPPLLRPCCALFSGAAQLHPCCQCLSGADPPAIPPQAQLQDVTAQATAWWEHSQAWEAAAQQAQQELAAAQQQVGGQEPGAATEAERLSAEVAAWSQRCAELEAQLAQQAQHGVVGSGDGSAAPAGDAAAELERAHAELASFGAELARAHDELAAVKAQQAQQLAELHQAQEALAAAQEAAAQSDLATQHAQRQLEALRARCAELEAAAHDGVAQGGQQAEQLAAAEERHAAEASDLRVRITTGRARCVW